MNIFLIVSLIDSYLWIFSDLKLINLLIACISLLIIFTQSVPSDDSVRNSDFLGNITPYTVPPVPINRTKNFMLCEINETPLTIQSTCDLISYNFTFYAYFKQKRSLRFKTVKDLSLTLANYSLCDVKYMKVNFLLH